MGQSGRALIEKRFTISSIASAYEILYIDMTLDRLV
jgi:hypothetical protein